MLKSNLTIHKQLQYANGYFYNQRITLGWFNLTICVNRDKTKDVKEVRYIKHLQCLYRTIQDTERI